MRVKWWLSHALKNILSNHQEDVHPIHNIIQDYAKHYVNTLKELGQLSAAATLHRDVDVAYQEHVASTDENKKLFSEVACGKGCYHCCLQVVMITEEEGFLIKQYCKENKIKINKKLLMRQRKADEKTWTDLPRPQQRCVFLSENNECSIYPVRPANCRKYFALWNSEQCDPYENPDGKVANMVSPVAEIMASAAMTMTKFCGSIPQVMLKVLEGR